MKNQKKAERNSNLESLRILLMFAIVMGHFVGQGGAYDILHGMNLFCALMLGSAARIAVSVFIMLGAWFMVDSKFKASRVLGLYSQLIFYTLGIMLFMISIGKISNYRIIDIVSGIFPFLSFACWFVSAWIWLMLLSPFLKRVLEWDRTKLKKILIVFTALIPVISTIFAGADYKLDVMPYFCYAFLCVGYYKKYLADKIKIKPYLPLIISIILYTLFVYIKFYAMEHNIPALENIIRKYMGNYKTIPNLIIAIPIFYYFINLNVKNNKFINFIAKPTLAVYIIHQTPGFFHYLWYGIFKSEYFLLKPYNLLYIISIPVILYIVAMVTEYIRKNISKLFNILIPNIYIYNGIQKIENKIDEFYKDI